MKVICSIYKSPRKDGMYLYVEKRDALKRVPEGLIAAFGPPQLAFEMVLTPERQLAREDITKVLANLQAQGPMIITCRCRPPRTITSSICPKSYCA